MDEKNQESNVPRRVLHVGLHLFLAHFLVILWKMDIEGKCSFQRAVKNLAMDSKVIEVKCKLCLIWIISFAGL